MFSSFLNIKNTVQSNTLSVEKSSPQINEAHTYTTKARYDNMICDISTEKYTQTNIFSPSDTDGRSDL